MSRLFPPKFFLRLFRWYCHPKLRDHIEGDLFEVYSERMKLYGKRKSDVQFIIDVILLFRPGIIKPIRINQNVTYHSMYRNYFRIGLRNLLKYKGYSFINIGGLALGMAVAILIGLWIRDELTFNRYHKNYDTIARVMRNWTLNNETITSTNLGYALGEELKTKYNHLIKEVVMFWPAGDHILSNMEESFIFRGTFIGSNGPDVFSLRMISGSLSGLNDPHAAFISESAAKTLFGNDSPIGEQLKIDNRMDVKVAGVYEDLPYNSDFHGMDFFAPWDLHVSSNAWMQTLGFYSNNLYIYVSIQEHTTFERASHEIRNAVLDNLQDDKANAAVNPQLFLHPMKDWHLRSVWKNGVNAGGLIQMVWLFGVIGAFVLLLACINFMNLSTARSEKRAREVGIRKAIGSVRSQLVSQFMSESFVVVGLSFIVAVALVAASLNWFNDISGKQIEMPFFYLDFWLASFVFIFLTGFLAGSYPAFYLSSFNAVRVLKGSLRVGRLAAVPRKVLVVVQFSVSIILIIGTIVIYQQIHFAKDRPVGYSRDGLLMLQKMSPDLFGKFDVLRTELKRSNVVTEIAESSSPPTDSWNSSGGFDWEGKDPSYTAEFATVTVTPQYGKTVGWEFISGRDFSEAIASDSAAFVINEAAARVLGFEDPVDKVIKWNAIYNSRFRDFKIIGVIRDMVMRSPFEPVKPAVYFVGWNKYWINIRVNPNTPMSEAISKIEAVFSDVVPGVPFDYRFADQEFARKFVTEERIGKLASVFSLLAIAISCLGLFGLASFVAEQRTKEIGIRKVVGASVFNLWKMLSVDFIVLVLISCLIAIPVAYLYLDDWLAKYEYRTSLSWPVFAVTCAGAVLITLLTVSYQAIKAAVMNPVKSLRSE